jgi:hypothetical protein
MNKKIPNIYALEIISTKSSPEPNTLIATVKESDQWIDWIATYQALTK